ncbi:MAG: biotin--[acetyl-CoA-carboxylase] ligase [Candidatus Omnitrophota bacterium]
MKNKILNYLKEKDDFVSGQGMSKALKMSRTAVWKYIKQLQEEGYLIQAISRRGYRLLREPDKILPDLIQGGLKTKIFGREIFYFKSVDSTMNEAAKLAAQGAQEGVVVCAETQTKGRGRLGRSWVSLKGKGIYFSVILRPRVSLSDASCLTLVFAVAVCQAIRLATGVDAKIKWPNDILVGQKKIAGILTELNAELDRIHFIILGVGINIGGQMSSLLAEATSLDREASRKVSRVSLLQEILRQMEKYYQLFHAQGFVPIADTWRSLSATLKAHVKVVELNKTTEGMAVDIDNQGALLIKEKSGVIVRKISGDIIHLYPVREDRRQNR